jgi:hypothetical protein
MEETQSWKISPKIPDWKISLGRQYLRLIARGGEGVEWVGEGGDRIIRRYVASTELNAIFHHHPDGIGVQP